MTAKIVTFPSRRPLREFRIALRPNEFGLPNRHVVEVVGLNGSFRENIDSAEHVCAGYLRVDRPLDPADEALIDSDLCSDPSLRPPVQLSPLTEFHRRLPLFKAGQSYDGASYFVNGHDDIDGSEYAPVAYIFVMHPGNRIRALRKAASMTQTELGERTGFGQDRISNYENGRRPLRLNELRILARELSCAPADLLDDQDNPERLSDEERLLLQAFRESSEGAKSFILASAQAVADQRDAA